MSELTEAMAVLADVMTQRGNFYAFLARVYREEINHDMLESLAAMDVGPEVPQAEMAEGYRLLQGFLSQRGEGTLTDLAVDYARLFLGVRREAAASPYESVYTSPEHLLMQEARDEVLALYRQEGLDRAEGAREPEDHLAFELEFMGYLCAKGGEALRAGNQEQASALLKKQSAFLQQHLRRWIPDFCNDMARIAQTDFYKAIAKLTSGFLALDADVLGDIADELAGQSAS